MSAHLPDELLSARLDKALDVAELAQVEGHLAGCPDCSRRLDLLRATTRAVAGLPDEAPGPLDLSFLPLTPARVVSLPAARGWRPPAWAAPVLAAAAVLVVAGGIGTMALKRPAPSSAGTATALGQQGRAFDGPVTSGGTGGPPAAGAGAAAAPQAVDNLGGAGTSAALPGRAAATGPAVTGTQSFPSAGNATLSVTAAAAVARRGQPIQVSLTLHAGTTAVEASGLQVTARRGPDSSVLLGAGAESIPPGHTSTLYGTWVAGQLGGDSTAPGDYRLEAHVLLADGTDLTVGVTVRVS